MFRGIYVHIPFCLRKCPYCDFVSYGIGSPGVDTGKGGGANGGSGPAAGGPDIDRYLAALLSEAQLYRNDYIDYIYRQDYARDYAAGKKPEITSLYIGGGTPTCLTGGQLFLLLSELRRLFPINDEAEITVEANPGTLDQEKLRALKESGCNRLSLGVQSFDERELKILGRIYAPWAIYDSCRLARQAGFANLGFDLMYGLPGQSPASWRRTLETAVELEPEHISVYQLKIEPGTPFFERLEKGLLAEFDQDLARQMQEEAIAILTSHGFHHYEISNFAKPGKESRHNRLYWQQEEYLGLGAGAGGYLGQMRYSNEPDLPAYLRAVTAGQKPVKSRETLTKELAMAETMFLGLRLLAGVNKEDFYQKYGTSIATVYPHALAKLKSQGLLAESDTHFFLTKEGIFLANLVFLEFLPG